MDEEGAREVKDGGTRKLLFWNVEGIERQGVDF